MTQPSPRDDDELAEVLDLTGRRRAPAGRGPAGSAGGDHATDEGADILLERLRAALPGPPMWLRVLIAVLALAQLVMVVPWLVESDPFGLLDASASHLTRDGSLGLVVVIVGLLAAWRPRWALPCFVVGSVALIAQAVAGLFDDSIAGARTTELVHLPSIVLTCLVGLSAVPLRALGPMRHRR